MKRTPLISALILTLSFLMLSSAMAQNRPQTVDEQRAWEEKTDIRNIRHSTQAMLADESPDFLKIPSGYEKPYDFTVAKTPPKVEFAVIQDLTPEYLPWALAKNAGGAWGGWGDVTKGPDGCFYFSISNHLSYLAETYIVKYDPVSKQHSLVMSAKDVCEWTDDQFADGKIHGDIDFDPDGDTYVLSYFGPVPKDWEWERFYTGSWLMHYNCFTGKAENLGIPLEGTSWPYHNYDWKRGLLFGVDHAGKQVIVYDTKARKMVYGGAPPDGIRWYARCILVDRENGDIYTSDSNTEERQIIRYRRRNNRFDRMNATVPVNPVTGKAGDFRAHSSYKDTDGAYWCFDHFGGIFKFWPAEDRTEYVTENWGEKGEYTANLCMSPGGRYLYYQPGLSGKLPEGTPIVQYDTKTGERKVIAFIFDYYMEKYGYAPVRCYGIELDEKGESLVLYANGGFSGRYDDNPYMIQVRRPAVFQIHIPASERVE